MLETKTNTDNQIYQDIVMELTGKIIAVLPERSGTAKSTGNPWKAQSFVIETHDTYPRKMVFDVFGEDRLQRFNIKNGQEVLVSFDIDAHEYQGRWYNSIRAYDVRLVDPASVNTAGAQPAPVNNVVGGAAAGGNNPAAPFPPQADSADDNADELPF